MESSPAIQIVDRRGVGEAAPEVVAVVVHWCGALETLDCLRGMWGDDPRLSVVLVDNASEDGSGGELCAALGDDPRVLMLRARRNGGFGSGVNLGVDAALRAWPWLGRTLLINPDAMVESGCLRALLDTADRHPQAGIVGGRVLDGEGRRVWFENGRFRPWTLSGSHVSAPAGQQEFETSFVTGALMLVDAGLWRDGLRFDERYFLYVEDLELCCAVRALGRELWITTRAVVRHAEGGSQRGERELGFGLRAMQLEQMTRGKVLLARQWLSPLQRASFLLTAALLKPAAAICRTRRLGFLAPYWRGLWSGLRAPAGARGR